MFVQLKADTTIPLLKHSIETFLYTANTSKYPQSIVFNITKGHIEPMDSSNPPKNLYGNCDHLTNNQLYEEEE